MSIFRLLFLMVFGSIIAHAEVYVMKIKGEVRCFKYAYSYDFGTKIYSKDIIYCNPEYVKIYNKKLSELTKREKELIEKIYIPTEGGNIIYVFK